MKQGKSDVGRNSVHSQKNSVLISTTLKLTSVYYFYLLYISPTGSVLGRDQLQPLQQLVHGARTVGHNPAGGGV